MATNIFPHGSGISQNRTGPSGIVVGTKVEYQYTTNAGAAASIVGRVCSIRASGLCCVQFAIFGCQKVPMDQLVPTSKPAPDCDPNCANC